MYVGLYVVYDLIAKEAGPVFTAKNDGVARRATYRILEKVPTIDRDMYKLTKLGVLNTESLDYVNGKMDIDVDVPDFDEDHQEE